ncbi:GumC family protein [Nitrospira sp. M1]
MEDEAITEAERLPYPLGSLRDILTTLFKHKVKILVAFSVVFLPILGWVYLSVPYFEAESTIVLKSGREHVVRPEVGSVQEYVDFDKEAAIQTELNIISSKDLARQVIQTIGIHKIYPELASASQEKGQDAIYPATLKFLGKLTTEPVNYSNVISLTFLHKDPQMAAMALNILIDLLKGKHLEVFSDPKASFLNNQLRNYEEKLKKSEAKLQAFKRKNNLTSSLKEHQQRLLNQKADLDMEYKKIKHQIHGLRSKGISLESQLQTIPQTIPLSSTQGDSVLKKAQEDLFDLQRQEQNLLGKYTEDSLPVQNLRKEIQLLEGFIREHPKEKRSDTIISGNNPTFQNLEITKLETSSALKTKQASMKVIADHIKELDNKILSFDQLSEDLAVLERQKNADEQNVQLYLGKVEEAKVSEEMDRLQMSNIRVIQIAEPPLQPIGRPAALKLLLGVILSSFFSLGVAFISEFLAGTYTRPDQAVEDLGLPVLASFYQRNVS